MKYITSKRNGTKVVSLFKKLKNGFSFKSGINTCNFLDVVDKELIGMKPCELFFSDDAFGTTYGTYEMQCCELAIRRGFKCRIHADNIRVFLTSFSRRFLEDNKDMVVFGTTIDSGGVDFDDKCFAIGQLKALGIRLWVHLSGNESEVYNRTCLYVKEFTCDGDYECHKLIKNKWLL